MEIHKSSTLSYHLEQVKEGHRCFENAFQSVARMILENGETVPGYVPPTKLRQALDQHRSETGG